MRQLKINDSIYDMIDEPYLLRDLVETEIDNWHAIAKWFKQRKLKSVFGRLPSVVKMDVEKSAKTLSMIFYIDKQEVDEIVLVVDRALKEKFWAQNLQSLATIRNKCKDGLTKYEHILKRIIEDADKPLAEIRRKSEFLELL